jgi:hypothetical protein
MDCHLRYDGTVYQGANSEQGQKYTEPKSPTHKFVGCQIYPRSSPNSLGTIQSQTSAQFGARTVFR